MHFDSFDFDYCRRCEKLPKKASLANNLHLKQTQSKHNSRKMKSTEAKQFSLTTAVRHHLLHFCFGPIFDFLDNLFKVWMACSRVQSKNLIWYSKASLNQLGGLFGQKSTGNLFLFKRISLIWNNQNYTDKLEVTFPYFRLYFAIGIGLSVNAVKFSVRI